MPFVVDDQTLFDVLARNAADLEVESIRGELFTTGSWYYRLARASAMGSGLGSLSGRLFDLSSVNQERVRRALDELPVGLLSLRFVVPVMQALRVQRPLNFLGAEALAAALMLDAEILVGVHAPLLAAAAAELKRRLPGPMMAMTTKWTEASEGSDRKHDPGRAIGVHGFVGRRCAHGFDRRAGPSSAQVDVGARFCAPSG